MTDIKIILGENMKSVKISDYEEAWEIGVIPQVLDILMKKNCVILGGDILFSNLEYSYDNWYFEPFDDKDYISNVKMSYNKANDYIKKYIEMNGYNYYVVLVVDFKK